ncbi:MAG: substrate-binding domain-containing protein [Candidatus Aureabacteria bacterium]|nr:substrate-binding domain-containing protein [Candidatus Auribacterota bacterium]
MQKKLLIPVVMCVAILQAGMRAGRAGAEELKGSITVSGAWALYPMAVKWAEEFQKIHPAVKIDVSAGGAGKGMADALAGVADIGMVSRAINPSEAQKGAWWVAVTKDAVVSTINENNPVIQALLARGVKRETLVGIWIRETVKNWGAVAGNDRKDPIHVYTRSDACGAAQTWAEYLGGKQEDLQGTGVYGDPGLAGAVKSDVLGVGFNNINYVYDAKTLAQVKGIKVLPIDLNGDGRIDEGEDFYKSRSDITKAINDGKYPSPPARELYFVCKGKPEKEIVDEFLKWVLTDGQRYVPQTGYINLSAEKLSGELKKLEGK